MPSEGLVLTEPLLLVMSRSSSMNVTPSNFTLSNSALSPLGITQLRIVTSLKTGRL
jgi:hypothetical protein